MADSNYTFPAGTGELVLGRTLPSLLDEACDVRNNERALNQQTTSGWQALSTRAFRDQAEALALGLVGLGLQRGDRIALYTHSDTSFCLADMACLLAGLVDVPIYLTHAEAAVRHILSETKARVLVVSDHALLNDISPALDVAEELETIILAEAPADLPGMHEGRSLTSFAALMAQGKAAHADAKATIEELKAHIEPDDLATIIYTSGTTGTPKGVMLSHQNISSNALGAFSGMGDAYRNGEEVALSFLPLTHIFARTLHYGYLFYGTAVYFSHPDHIREHFGEVQPTIFATVPRVLEKAYERILARGGELHGLKKQIFDWSLELARRYDVSKEPTGLFAAQLALADKLVLSKWRDALGGRIRMVIVGGAALRGELVNLFGAAKVKVLQGYGLTETSPVISYNRPQHNRAGTVGTALPGVEVNIAEDGEILSRGPHIMQGYYQNEAATHEAINEDGWFHTGDSGEMAADGFLVVTGRLKNNFKLSTGKYVTPQPLEQALEASALIEQAMVVGEGEKYCAALIFLSQEQLTSSFGYTPETVKQTLEDPGLQQKLRDTIEAANKELPHWSRVKRATLIVGELSTDNELLTPTLKLRRRQVKERYADYLETMYGRQQATLPHGLVLEIEEAAATQAA